MFVVKKLYNWLIKEYICVRKPRRLSGELDKSNVVLGRGRRWDARLTGKSCECRVCIKGCMSQGLSMAASKHY